MLKILKEKITAAWNNFKYGFELGSRSADISMPPSLIKVFANMKKPNKKAIVQISEDGKILILLNKIK